MKRKSDSGSSNISKKLKSENFKQLIKNGRFNIIAQKGRVDTLVIGHLDTVQPTSGWIKNPIESEIIEDKLYGLGASDMKSGIAIMLHLATLPDLANNIAFLFYCDEEYNFLGIRKSRTRG